MLLSIIRFIGGYVDFRVGGRFPERFLNITARNGVRVWNAVPCGEGFSASMYAGDYRRIRPLAKKARVKLKTTRRHGLPFFIKRYRDRVGLAAGAIAGFALITVLSNFVWSVTVSGNESLSEQYLRGILKDNGVFEGAYINSIDVERAERSVQLAEGRVGWISVNITGSLVSVELKESTEKSDGGREEDSESPSNLKACSDGVITEINVRSGVTMVKKGSGVAKGDLLVSGVSEKIDERYSSLVYLRSEGEIYADVNSEKEFTLKKNYSSYFLTGKNTSRTDLEFFHINMPFGFNFTTYENFISRQSERRLLLGDVIMPIGITTQTDYELEERAVSQSADAAEEIFENEAMIYELSEKAASKTVSRKLIITQTDDKYVCKAEYVFNENIAENVDFSVIP